MAKEEKSFNAISSVKEQEFRKELTQVEKASAIEKALLAITKDYGNGSVMKMDGSKKDYPHIPTGILPLDIALGVGGLPKGRIIEVYGAESSGKTSAMLSLVASAQKLGGMCAFVDFEHSLDISRAVTLGVNAEELLVSQPDTLEEGLGIVGKLVESQAFAVIIVDSTNAMTPKAELAGEVGDSHMGLRARLLSQALLKLKAEVSKSGVLLVFISQTRMKIGVVFGSPTVIGVGNAMKFYASVRLEVSRIETLKKGEDAIGIKTRVKVTKNKVAPPFKKAEYDLFYDIGYSRHSQVVYFAVKLNIVSKAGAWYSYGETRLGQGADNTRLFLQDNPKMFNEIENKVLTHFGFANIEYVAKKHVEPIIGELKVGKIVESIDMEEVLTTEMKEVVEELKSDLPPLDEPIEIKEKKDESKRKKRTVKK